MNNENDNNLMMLEKELIALHNKAAYVFTLWTEDWKFIDCNDAATEFFGVKSKEEYVKNISHYIPKFQSEGLESLEDAIKYLKECHEAGIYYKEFTMKRPYNTKLPVYFALQRIKISDSFYIVSYHFGLDDLNSFSKEIETRNKLLKALNKISELAITPFDIDAIDMGKMMHYILKTMGSAGRADRCYIWENYYPTDSSLLFMRQIYEWVEGVEAVQDSEIIDYVTYDPDTYDWLSAGNALNAIVKEMSEYDRTILEPQGIKSILCSPVHIDGEFWGFVGFDNCHSEELWESFEEEILRTASFITATIVSKFAKAKKG
jgi:hypothetical protein